MQLFKRSVGIITFVPLALTRPHVNIKNTPCVFQLVRLTGETFIQLVWLIKLARTIYN